MDIQNIYYVYVIKRLDEVLYIGKGKGQRFKMNYYKYKRMYRTGVTIEIYKEHLQEHTALSIELKLIQELNPKHNKVTNHFSGVSRYKRTDRQPNISEENIQLYLKLNKLNV